MYSQIATPSQELLKFQISQDYFSSILNAQLVIFSVIVAAIVALYFLFNYRVSKKTIKEEVEASIKIIKDELKEDFKKQTEDVQVSLATEISRHENEIGSLRGSIYRTLGEFWDSEKAYDTGFIWWVRAAHQFAIIKNEERLTRIALGHARDSAEKIEWDFQLTSELIGEYQRLYPQIPDDLYKIEKDLLDKEVKKVLTKRPSTSSVPMVVK